MIRKLWQCLTCWGVRIASPTELAMADVILTQAWEYDRDGSPGPGNLILGSQAMNLARRYGLGVIPQKELLLAAPELPCVAVVGQKPMLTAFGWRPAHTAQICKEQVEACKRLGYTRPILVTAPDHWWRSVMCYRKLGLQVLVAPMPPHEEAQYYGDAVRVHMRWRATFRAFDRLARVIYWATGKL